MNGEKYGENLLFIYSKSREYRVLTSTLAVQILLHLKKEQHLQTDKGNKTINVAET